MAADESFQNYVMGLLTVVGGISGRAIFGGRYGIFYESAMFGIIEGTSLFFMVGDSNRRDYETAGSKQHRTHPDYQEVPVDVLNNTMTLLDWARASMHASKQSDMAPHSEQEIIEHILGAESDKSVPELCDLLKHEDVGTRFRAAEALARMGTNAESAVPTLIDLLESRGDSFGWQIAATFGRIGESAVVALIDALKDERPLVRVRAAQALGLVLRRLYLHLLKLLLTMTDGLGKLRP